MRLDKLLDKKVFKAACRATKELGLPNPQRVGKNKYVCLFHRLKGESISLVRILVEKDRLQINDISYYWYDPKTGDDQTWYNLIKKELNLVLDQIS